MANTKRKKNAFFHFKLILVKGIHLEWVNAFIIYSAFLGILSLCPISTFFCTTQEQTGDFNRVCGCLSTEACGGKWWRESLRSCTTLCNPVDCSPPGSSVCGVLQARILEWVAMPSSRGSPWPRDWTCVSFDSCIAGGFFTTELLGKPPNNPNMHKLPQESVLTNPPMSRWPGHCTQLEFFSGP